LFQNDQLTVFFSPRALILITQLVTSTHSRRHCAPWHIHPYSNHSFFINLSFYVIFLSRVTKNLKLISHRISRVITSKKITQFFYSRNIFPCNLT